MKNDNSAFRFSIQSGKAHLTRYTGGLIEAYIPETFDGYPVTAIGSYAFYENGAELRRIVVPGSVKQILPHAFELCICAEEIVLSEGICEIGEDAFTACGIKSLYIPSSVTRIHRAPSIPCAVTVSDKNPVYSSDGYGLYKGNCLVAVNPSDTRTDYRIRAGTQEIRLGVFEDCDSLKSIHLPASLKTAGEGVFSNTGSEYSGRTGITDITVDEKNPFFFRDPEFLGERTRGGVRLIRWMSSGENVVLPENITEISREAFSGTPIKRLIVPGKLEAISPDAFRGCALTEADIHCPRIHILFPNDNPYLRKDLLRGFGRNGLIYDFKIYDDKLMEWRTDADRLSMMLTRLKYGCFLNEDRRKTFLDILRNHLTEAAVAAAVENRMDLIILMEELQLFDADNIDAVLSELEIHGRHEMAASLSAWKHANLASASFDYSL